MDKLIITCCVSQEQPYFAPEAMVNMPITMRQIADSVREAHDAGAAAAHVHQPLHRKGGHPLDWDRENYLELNRLIRQTDVVFEHRGANPAGVRVGWRGGKHKEDPDEALSKDRELRQINDVPFPDAVPVIIGPQHMDWGKDQHYVMPILSVLEEYMRRLKSIKVKPKFECWPGAYAFHNVRRLAGEGLVDAPFWLELNMGCPGSTSPPATLEELIYITKKLPERSVWHVWYQHPPLGTMSPQEGLVFLTQAITMGGHIRVGMEDSPYNWDGKPAQSNAQIVEGIVRVARAMGREVATSAEAREMLGMPPHK